MFVGIGGLIRHVVIPAVIKQHIWSDTAVLDGMWPPVHRGKLTTKIQFIRGGSLGEVSKDGRIGLK